MLSCPISVEIFFLWPGLVTPMAVRSWKKTAAQVPALMHLGYLGKPEQCIFYDDIHGKRNRMIV